MRRLRSTSVSTAVEAARDGSTSALLPEEIARRRRVVAAMRRHRDEVIGVVDGTIAELLSEEDEDPAHR